MVACLDYFPMEREVWRRRRKQTHCGEVVFQVARYYDGDNLNFMLSKR